MTHFYVSLSVSVLKQCEHTINHIFNTDTDMMHIPVAFGNFNAYFTSYHSPFDHHSPCIYLYSFQLDLELVPRS